MKKREIRRTAIYDAEQNYKKYRTRMGLYSPDVRVQFEKYYEAIQELKGLLEEKWKID
jgi:hypothetical protein